MSALRGALGCGAVGAIVACVWALLTPTFEVPDEHDHFAYAQHLAESGELPPDSGAEERSRELEAVLRALPGIAEGKPSWSREFDRRVQAALDRPREGPSAGWADAAAGHPPLYYAYEAAGYRLGGFGNALDRILVMRLLSALLAGVTVFFTFLFVRELLPGTPWAWPVGALVVAFQPMLGFVSGGINNDALIYATSAALIYLLARALRRGLEPRVGVAIGAVLLGALLTKGSAFGLVPAVAAALGLALWRASERERRRATAGALAALAVAAVPFAGWVVVSEAALDRAGATTGGYAREDFPQGFSVEGQLTYAWQFFLPRLPGMVDHFTGLPSYPVWDVMFQGFVGRFGWLKFGFPAWANWLALGIVVGLGALAGRELWRRRMALRARWPEAAVYGLAIVGMVGLLIALGYRHSLSFETRFEQVRYVLGLLPLYGLFVALAARGAGSRYGPAVGVAAVTIAFGHTLFALLLTIQRYYL